MSLANKEIGAFGLWGRKIVEDSAGSNPWYHGSPPPISLLPRSLRTKGAPVTRAQAFRPSRRLMKPGEPLKTCG